eukprot:Selendium_serpulae@DN6942_c0_g1_i1.p1
MARCSFWAPEGRLVLVAWVVFCLTFYFSYLHEVLVTHRRDRYLSSKGMLLERVAVPDLAAHQEVNLAVTRVTGNNLPPLQGYNQQRRNVEKIISIEPFSIRMNATTTMTYYQLRHNKEKRLALKIWYSASQHFARKRHKTTEVQGDSIMYFIKGPNAWMIDDDAAQLGGMRTSSSMPPLPENAVVFFHNTTRFKVSTMRSFAVNRVINHTEYEAVKDMFTRHGELVVDMPGSMEHLAQAEMEALYMTNQNTARNYALTEMGFLGATWIAALDGNVALTKDGYLRLIFSALAAECLGKYYYFVPMFRLKPRNDRLVKADVTLDDLAPHLSPNEAQLSLRHNAPKIFDTGKAYGRRNKLALLRTLKGDPRWVHTMHCLE